MLIVFNKNKDGTSTWSLSAIARIRNKVIQKALLKDKKPLRTYENNHQFSRGILKYQQVNF